MLDPEVRKQRIVAALSHHLLAKAARAPVLLLLEDLHWGDDASLELIGRLARVSAARPLLLLLTYRTDERSAPLRRLLVQLDREQGATELVLAPLEAAEVGAMLRAILARGQPVPRALLDAVYPLTDGNPLLVEEVLRSLGSLGALTPDAAGPSRRPLHELPIPRTVQHTVQQRVEQLGPTAHHLLALAAVAGRQFDVALLQELAQLDEPALLQALRELLSAQFVVKESAERFAFRHALVREAVYAGLLARERATLHRALAETIERRAAEATTAYLSDLAYHYEASGAWEQTFGYAQRAAEQAIALHAPHAAAEHLTRAIRAGEQLGHVSPALYRARGQAYATLGTFPSTRPSATFTRLSSAHRLLATRPLPGSPCLTLASSGPAATTPGPATATARPWRWPRTLATR